MTDYVAKIADLNIRVADTHAKLTSLAEKRRKLALEAADGDKTAIRAIEQIDSEATALSREHETLVAAIEQTQRLKREEEGELARKDLERREAEARKIADAVLAVSAEIDEAMTAMRVMLERRTKLGRELGRTGVVPSTIILRLQQKLGPTSAARAAGLHNFLSLEPMQQNQVRPLVASSNVPIRQSAAAGGETEAA